MKRTILRNFKQIYTHPVTKEKVESDYQVTVVRDTEDYKYRILNTTAGTIWKNQRFDTYDEALAYLNSHPHATKDAPREITLNRIY